MKQSNFLSAPPPAQFRVETNSIQCEDVPSCIRGNSVLCIHNGGHEARTDLLDAGLAAVGFRR